ncbi:MAG: type IV pilus assembly protein PilM, partial [Pedosphaera parvula]|nr:type IV pilus assembly protein PilM [Pedosphaera parvula]
MKSFLCGDFGAGTLKIAEFEPSEAGSLRLKKYLVRPLGFEGAQDASRSEVLLRTIQDALSAGDFGSREINVCTAGFNVFSKFVKLPPVDTAKVTQIIQYEAQQNVPFPLEEVVWDYQILGAAPSGELEVLLVAIKSDIVEGLFRTSESAGLRLQLVDVSPAALCNAFRFNYGDEEGCTMLLDIGAKTSNLLFFEKGKVFSRSINIGANAITQDFGHEARLSFAEAEQIKIAEGFVGLGGAYAEPDNPHQAQISKIARQVMTRLHIQMNQTIQFYRNQQSGSAPQRLYLAGGATLMPYTAQFFAEKLNIPVDYFNPLRNVEIGENIDLDALAQVAHTFGEVVGLSIRNLAQCPVELNLMPKSYLKRKQFDQKKPYFMAAVVSLVLVVASYGLFYDRVAAAKRVSVAKLKAQTEPLQAREAQLRAAMEGLRHAYDTADNYVGQMND